LLETLLAGTPAPGRPDDVQLNGASGNGAHGRAFPLISRQTHG